MSIQVQTCTQAPCETRRPLRSRERKTLYRVLRKEGGRRDVFAALRARRFLPEVNELVRTRDELAAQVAEMRAVHHQLQQLRRPA